MEWKVPQFTPYIGEEEALAAAECIRSGWITEGPKSSQFVEEVKKITGTRYGVLAPNGTLALYLALKACDFPFGHDVIVPDLTFIATATAVRMAGLIPVFADVNSYGQLSKESVTRVKTSSTVAVVPVHLYGLASNEIPMEGPAITCIEDACQGFGVKYLGRPCGSFGKASAFSFFADKTITTGEGGFVGTNEVAIYNRLRLLRNQGRMDRGSFIHSSVGQNFRMTDIQAAIGLVQLRKMPEIVARKQEIFKSYSERLSGIVRLLEPPPGSTHIPFRTVAIFEEPAEEAALFLKTRGVEPRSSFYPLHKQPCFPQYTGHESFANSEFFWNHALCLPTFPSLTEEQIGLVCGAIKEFRGVR